MWKKLISDLVARLPVPRKNKMSYKSVVDYYAILGVQPSATLKDITSAYRKLAKEKHPDKNPNDPRAKEKFIKLKEVFDFLQVKIFKIPITNFSIEKRCM